LIVGVGKQRSDIRRIERALSLFGDCSIQRVFTPDEQKSVPARESRVELYGRRFAAKQACATARVPGYTTLPRRAMSVINLPAGRPAITLSSNASARW
jgi:phosphopantetheinyl transferase (holo-ACP synthase)